MVGLLLHWRIEDRVKRIWNAPTAYAEKMPGFWLPAPGYADLLPIWDRKVSVESNISVRRSVSVVEPIRGLLVGDVPCCVGQQAEGDDIRSSGDGSVSRCCLFLDV